MASKRQELAHQALEKIISNAFTMNILGEFFRERIQAAGSALELGKTILTEEEAQALSELTAEDLDQFRIRQEWLNLSTQQKLSRDI